MGSMSFGLNGHAQAADPGGRREWRLQAAGSPLKEGRSIIALAIRRTHGPG
jgi:hypothetical protein